MQPEVFFLQLVLILLSARFLGELVAKWGVPSVIGELLAGVILGPSLLGLLSPNEFLKLLAEIGVIFLLFEVGLETDLSKLKETGSKPFIAALVGVAAPFAFGFFTSYSLFHMSLLVSLFVASTMTATSIGITLRVLHNLKLDKSRESQIVLGAAVIDDIIGVVLLALLYEFASGGGVDLLNGGKILFLIVLFMITAPFVAKFAVMIIEKFEKTSEIPGLLPTTIFSLILLFGWIAHYMGAPILLGGFAAGIALSPQFTMPFGQGKKAGNFSHKVEKEMKPIIHLFTPIFFVIVGLSLNLKEIDYSSPFIWGFSSLILGGAILGKLLSGWSLLGESSYTKWMVGLSMIPRGEVGLIFAEVGKSAEVFDNNIYASLILVIALTTLLAPFAMKLYYQKCKPVS